MIDGSRDFDLGDILSITTGKLLSPKGISGVYTILNFMTGDNLYTHQLPRACEQCAPVLLCQHPQLAGVATPDFDGKKERVQSWLKRMKRRYGAKLPVAPVPPAMRNIRDPLEELHKMVPGKPIIAVETA